jgi:hypothetical protein
MVSGNKFYFFIQSGAVFFNSYAERTFFNQWQK